MFFCYYRENRVGVTWMIKRGMVWRVKKLKKPNGPFFMRATYSGVKDQLCNIMRVLVNKKENVAYIYDEMRRGRGEGMTKMALVTLSPHISVT